MPAIHFLHFTSIFAKHTTKYETLSIIFSHFMWISCFINAAKKSNTQSCDFFVWMPTLAGNVKREKRGAKYTPIHFLFFTFHAHFHIFYDTCIASLTPHNMEIWWCLCEISHRWRGATFSFVAWLRRHSSITLFKKKDCNMSRFWAWPPLVTGLPGSHDNAVSADACRWSVITNTIRIDVKWTHLWKIVRKSGLSVWNFFH